MDIDVRQLLVAFESWYTLRANMKGPSRDWLSSRKTAAGVAGMIDGGVSVSVPSAQATRLSNAKVSSVGIVAEAS